MRVVHRANRESIERRSQARPREKGALPAVPLRGTTRGTIGTVLAILALALAVVDVSPGVSADDWITKLEGVPGFNERYNDAYAINEAGQVAGTSYKDRVGRGWLWENGTTTNLGTLCGNGECGDESHASDINEAGQVVGSSNMNQYPGTFFAFLWQNGVMSDLGIRPASGASAINDVGQIVGVYSSPSGQHAFLWDDGVLTDLGTLGGRYSVASGINNAGQVVGRSEVSVDVWHAFLWQNGEMIDLGTLGGSDSYANDINEAGQVVDWSKVSSDTYHAFLWEDGAMTDLGTLGGDLSEAHAINNAGRVVGWAATKEWKHAFVWEDGNMSDLGSLESGDSDAFGLNELGKVVGTSFSGDPTFTAVMWNLAVGPIHDVAVTHAKPMPDSVVVGMPVWITGQVLNNGTRSENFTMSVYAGDILVGADNVTDLAPGTSTAKTFQWNTSGVNPGSYQVRVEASRVPDEENVGDNLLVGPTIEIYAPLEADATARPNATDVGISVTFTCDQTDRSPPFGPWKVS